MKNGKGWGWSNGICQHWRSLRSLVEEAASLLRGLSEAEVAARPKPDKWSKKEIIGHLMDSASNNHQRFTRAALGGSLTFPGYQQARLVPLA